jgi:hypothetical protein
MGHCSQCFQLLGFSASYNNTSMFALLKSSPFTVEQLQTINFILS